ncbi:MAG: M1 family aminopeptidase, partial [Proteobacteria bacterium]|nr:M1 family aminopeptidase [Pseudomonadota bacterium]
TVDFGLFMSDLAPVFLERYVPASLELDQFPLNLQLRVTESDTRHNIYTNGKILKNEGVNWSVQFPKHFGGSCHFFHVSGNEFKTLESHYISIDGRTVPIVIYGQSETQKAALESAQSSLSKLEQLFGPYPHDKLLMYLAYPDDWGGGMEYCGAIKTSLFAISHEIAHQWFGRGVLSSDGNSGWIDEAIATWIDNRMPADSRACLTLQEPTNLANHSPFSRVTPLEAYSTGARIMECIAGRLDAAKALSLTQVLRELVGEYKFRPLSTKAFQEFIQNKTSHNFESVFQTSVYGY